MRLQFSISPSNEQSGLISFRIDWLYFLAIQGILKSLLQNYSSKTSILWHSAFFTDQLSYLSMTAGKIIALTSRTFVSKVMSLLFSHTIWICHNFFFQGAIILISWLQSPSAVIWGPKKIHTTNPKQLVLRVCVYSFLRFYF